MRWSLCSLSSGTAAPVFLRASKTLAFGFRSPAQRLCFCDRWHITQGMLSDSQLRKQINFYYCFACLLSSYLIDSLITGQQCITVTLWGTMKGGCLEMIDFSLQCWFFLIYLLFYFFISLFSFSNLTHFFVTAFSHLFLSICTIAVEMKCERNSHSTHTHLVMWAQWVKKHSFDAMWLLTV